MTTLTGAPGWTDAWRTLFEKGDVVGIKVCPVGGPTFLPMRWCFTRSSMV